MALLFTEVVRESDVRRNGSRLVLQADNDFDSNGLALTDEFSDVHRGVITDGFGGGIDFVSISPIAD